MRKSIVVVAMLIAVAVAVPRSSDAACLSPTPMAHLYDSYIRCADGGPISAYAWQVSAPTAHNTGPNGIACRTAGENACISPNSGIVGDGIVTIETDWSNPGTVGCPNQRVAISLQCSDGTGIIVSLSGANFDFGYTVELAHPPSADGLSFDPLTAGSDNARPKVVSQSVAAGVLNANLHFNPVRVACDCDPGSVGFAVGACTDSFVCTGSAGTVYTKVADCASDPGAALSGWVTTTVTPNAAGDATISVALPTGTNQCLFIGAPSVVGGQTSTGITGFIRAAGTLAAADRAIDVRAAQAQGKVTVSFRTESELGAVSFDIVASGRVIASIPAKGGNGVGASYEAWPKVGDFRGKKELVVRTNGANGSILNTSDPVSF